MVLKAPVSILPKNWNDRGRVVCGAFAEGCKKSAMQISTWQYLLIKNQHPPRVAVYGILYGGNYVMQNTPNYWHIDHGYFGRSTDPDLYDGYYRITHNNFWHNGSGDNTWDRFNSLGIELKDWRKTGDHIVIVPPSVHMAKALDMQTWLEETIFKIKKKTDRDVIVSSKYKNPMSEVIKDAWCVVTDHSNSAIDAMINGIPAIFTNPARKLGTIEEVENPPMNREFFKNLAHNQWTLQEIKSGKAWSDLNGRST